MNNRAMKDSGVEWMEEIPSHWEVSKVKNLATEKNTVFLDGDWIESEFITNSGVRLIQTGNIGVGFYKEQGFRYITEETFEILNCRYIEAGDLLISRLAGPVGRSCLAPKLEEKMICSVDICSLRPNENIDPKFLNFHFTAKGHLEYCSLIARGATLQRISRKQLGNVAVVIPPLHEQQAIATYLDEKVSNLDRLINDQQMVIEEWKAYKQSLITETVTKGLNPEVNLKDSGIDWIGEIPIHWRVKRLKFVSNCLDGKRVPISSEKRKKGNVPYWGAGSVTDYVSDYLFNEELLLLGEDGAPFNDAFRDVAFYVNEPIWANNHIHVLKIKTDYSPKFIKHSLNCVDYNRFIGGSILPKLTQSKMNQIELPIPPLHEQQQIVNFLDEKCSKIDRLIEDKQHLIEELKTYKQSLIYECVTGKKEIV